MGCGTSRPASRRPIGNPGNGSWNSAWLSTVPATSPIPSGTAAVERGFHPGRYGHLVGEPTDNGFRRVQVRSRTEAPFSRWGFSSKLSLGSTDPQYPRGTLAVSLVRPTRPNRIAAPGFCDGRGQPKGPESACGSVPGNQPTANGDPQVGKLFGFGRQPGYYDEPAQAGNCPPGLSSWDSAHRCIQGRLPATGWRSHSGCWASRFAGSSARFNSPVPKLKSVRGCGGPDRPCGGVSMVAAALLPTPPLKRSLRSNPT